jgi:hypothetical protein
VPFRPPQPELRECYQKFGAQGSMESLALVGAAHERTSRASASTVRQLS